MDKSYTPSGGQTFEARRQADGKVRVSVAGEKDAPAFAPDLERTAVDSQTLRLQRNQPQNRSLFWVYAKGNRRVVSWPGGSVELDAAELTDSAAGGAGSLKPLKLTMPGKVLSVKVKEGDVVEVGQGLVIVEAMKMENLLLASAKAKIAKVHVQAGDRLESGTLLITFVGV